MPSKRDREDTSASASSATGVHVASSKKNKHRTPATTGDGMEVDGGTLFLLVATFDDPDFSAPGAIVVAKDSSHAKKLLASDPETCDRKVESLDVVGLSKASATIIGRSALSSFSDVVSEEPLRAFICPTYMTDDGVKAASLVVSNDATNAEMILNQKLILHELGMYSKQRGAMTEIELTHTNVIVV